MFNLIVVPGSPVDLRTTRVGLDYVVMDWKPPKEDGRSKITNYIVEMREEGSTKWSKIATTKLGEEYYKADFLKTGVPYFFAVSAQNKVGTGERAEITSAIVPQKEAGM